MFFTAADVCTRASVQADSRLVLEREKCWLGIITIVACSCTSKHFSPSSLVVVWVASALWKITKTWRKLSWRGHRFRGCAAASGKPFKPKPARSTNDKQGRASDCGALRSQMSPEDLHWQTQVRWMAPSPLTYGQAPNAFE